jgi:Fe-S oxidoreductase
MTLILALLSYGITAVALTLIALKGREIYRIIKSGQPDPTRGGNPVERARTMVSQVLLHTKMKRFTPSGIAHWFVMIGFVTLFGSLVQAYGEVISPTFKLPIIGNWFVYRGFVFLIAALTGVGILTLMKVRFWNMWFRKGRKNRFEGSSAWRGIYVELTIVAIVVCVFVLQLSHNEKVIQVTAAIKIIVSMAWFIVLALNLTMGVAWHRFLAPFNIYFKRNSDNTNSLGAIPEMLSHGKPINFEDPQEDDVFGIGKAADISWKGLLDMASCTECGRCQSQCPAWHTEKPLSPKMLIMAMRDHALTKVPNDAPIVGNAHENAINPDVLWSCTSCGACVEECPVDIEHVDHIMNMRRYQVLVESEFPSELGNTFRNLEKAGNPWGANRADRDAWISECDFPVTVIDGEIPEDVEYLFWVGCAGAFEDRAKKTTKAVAELLYMANVKFAVLGKKETCTGDPARRAGNEFLYQILSRENIETLQETFGTRGTKKVVVTCPHCFTTIGRDYKQQGFELEMMHHTQLLNQLVKEKRLTPVAPANPKSLTYHDPCYLGRHNQIYAPPRELLEATGSVVTEMPRNQERSFCCGAGGARMWQEEKLGTRINLNRVDEAIATGVEEVAVGCPFCRVMVSDGVNARQSEIEVLDVAQALLRTVKPINNEGNQSTAN